MAGFAAAKAGGSCSRLTPPKRANSVTPRKITGESCMSSACFLVSLRAIQARVLRDLSITGVSC